MGTRPPRRRADSSRLQPPGHTSGACALTLTVTVTSTLSTASPNPVSSIPSLHSPTPPPPPQLAHLNPILPQPHLTQGDSFGFFSEALDSPPSNIRFSGSTYAFDAATRGATTLRPSTSTSDIAGGFMAAIPLEWRLLLTDGPAYHLPSPLVPLWPYGAYLSFLFLADGTAYDLSLRPCNHGALAYNHRALTYD